MLCMGCTNPAISRREWVPKGSCRSMKDLPIPVIVVYVDWGWITGAEATVLGGTVVLAAAAGWYGGSALGCTLNCIKQQLRPPPATGRCDRRAVLADLPCVVA